MVYRWVRVDAGGDLRIYKGKSSRCDTKCLCCGEHIPKGQDTISIGLRICYAHAHPKCLLAAMEATFADFRSWLF